MSPDPLRDHPRFRKIRTLGNGAQGFVQLAEDRRTGEKLAIKFIQRGWDNHHTKYVLRELLNHQELSATQHPHIVEFKEVFNTTTYLAIAMEYVEGDNLQTFLESMNGKLQENLARFVFQQLLIAIDFCHRKGKVNRDLKLANTLIALTDGQLPLLKLCDFGFSKDTYRHSAPQSQVGTALFVAPEVMIQINGQSYDGKAADVWACGIILFITLFGKHPFLRAEDTSLPQNVQIVKLFQRVVNSDYYIAPEEQHSVSPDCLDLLQHILVADPQRRFTVPQIMQHSWFANCLPEGAHGMNDHYLSRTPAFGAGQAAADIERLVQQAEVPNIDSLSPSYASSSMSEPLPPGAHAGRLPNPDLLMSHMAASDAGLQNHRMLAASGQWQDPGFLPGAPQPGACLQEELLQQGAGRSTASVQPPSSQPASMWQGCCTDF
jgi:serine/threonine-protein kinase SRK2